MGEPPGPWKYQLTDKAEEELVHRLNEDGFQGVSKELRAHRTRVFCGQGWRDGIAEGQEVFGAATGRTEQIERSGKRIYELKAAIEPLL